MSTTQDLINYYADLLILQYVGKTKAYATVQALVTPVIMDQLPTQVMNAFNLTGNSVAQGVQLDVIGKYVGVSRTGYGFGGTFITLVDSDYLSLIKFKAISNSSNSSLYTIQLLLSQFFPNEVFVIDYANMHMSYLINSSIGSSDLIQLLVENNILPKPMGVQLGYIIYGPVINAFFGFRTYTAAAFNSSPFNTYTNYQTTWPWLTYEDRIQILSSLEAEDGSILVQETGDALYMG